MADLLNAYPDILDVNQLSKALHLSRSGAYQLMHQATFPTLRIGKRLLVQKAHLLLWIEANTQNPPSCMRAPHEQSQ